MAVQRLTTNVTGHFAFFMRAIFNLHFLEGFIYFLYIFFFFAGSFVSSFLIEIISRKSERFIYTIPASIECLLLLIMGIWGGYFAAANPDVIVFCLLFAMGLQNALVTKISNASVRTTHLTGLFTDLGIELSQLFFYTAPAQRHKLLSSIRLRFRVVFFFFMGGIAGGILYTNIRLYALCFAALVLVAGLIYDSIRFRVILLKRKLIQKQ